MQESVIQRPRDPKKSVSDLRAMFDTVMDDKAGTAQHLLPNVHSVHRQSFEYETTQAELKNGMSITK